MLASLGDGLLAQARAEEAAPFDGLLEGVDLATAWAAFVIQNRISESLYIKVLKGRATLQDGEQQHMLEAGQEYRRPWGPSRYPVSWESVKLVVQRATLSIPKLPEVCTLLRAKRDTRERN